MPFTEIGRCGECCGRRRRGGGAVLALRGGQNAIEPRLGRREHIGSHRRDGRLRARSGGASGRHILAGAARLLPAQQTPLIMVLFIFQSPLRDYAR